MELEIRKKKDRKEKKGREKVRIVVMLGCLSMRGILGC